MAKKMYEVPGFIEERPRRILELCEYLTPVMNEIHGTDYSLRFWATLLKDYVKTCLNRENLMSEKIIKKKALLLPFNGWSLPTIKDRWKIHLRYLANVVLKNSSIKAVHAIISQNNNICVGSRAEYFEEYGIGVYCPEHYPICLSFLGNGKRKKTNNIAKKGKSIFHQNLIRQLPQYYIECFSQLLNKIDLINPADKTFHAEHISGFMEMLVALYVERGAQYYRYQLGGFIGETKESVAEDKYIDIDKHLTYGWGIHEKDEPSKAFRLEEFKRNYKALTSIEQFDVAIIYNQVNSIVRKEYYSEVSQLFFEKINTEKYTKILLRPRGSTKKVDNSSELSFLELPNKVKVDKGMKSMAEIVNKSQIIVQLDHPSTNFLECLYVNHPIVAILSNNRPTEIVLPYYRFFLEEGVMHSDMDSLVSHLNTIELESWWHAVVNKPMYQEFKNKFAREV